jgi:hypothetical protein
MRLTRRGENRNLLAFDEAVEHVDHRHVGADHPRRQGPPRGVRRGTCNLDLWFLFERRSAVYDPSVAGKNPPQNVGREGDARRVAEKAHDRPAGQALRASEHLQRGLAGFQLDHLCEATLRVSLPDDREVTIARTFRIVARLG